MKKILFTLIVFSLIFILSTCFFTGNTSVSVSPVIKAIGLPTGITSVELTVSGPGMNTIGVVYDGLPSSIDLTVPSGSDRTFELVVYVDGASAATSFKGTATADLSQGNVEITISMGLNSTKIVIPDNNNNRLVQIDDMSGNGWKEIINTDIGFIPGLDPNDIGFDSQGRIYIAVDTASSTDPFIIRIDNLDSITYTPIVMGKATPCTALTADRENGYLYYTTFNELWRCSFEGSDDTLLSSAFATTRGLTIDDNGLIYIAHGTTFSVYDPFTDTTLDALGISSSGYEEAWDIIVKSSLIYAAVSDYNGSGWERLYQLNYEAGFLAIQNTYPTDTFGSHRFLAPLNEKLYFIDEDIATTDRRLVALDAIDDAVPEYYGTNGSGIGQFAFY